MRAAPIIAAIICVTTACADDHTRPDPRCVDGEEIHTNVSPADDDPKIVSPSSDPPLGGICDGSDTIRLVVASDDGPSALAAYAWRDMNGRPLLIVDGHCHYYAVGQEYGPMTQGYLTMEMLREITADLALDTLGDLPSHRDDCADHWSDRLIATQDQSLRCRCDYCGEGTPSTIALTNGVAWLERLADEGEPLTGVLRALALPQETLPVVVVAKKQTVFEWPLDAAIERIAGLAADGIGPDRGAYFSGDDAAALRRLRKQGTAMLLDEELGVVPWLIYVRDCGQTYALNMRDELPARVETELEALLDVAWKRPHIPTCLTFDFAGLDPRSPCPL